VLSSPITTRPCSPASVSNLSVATANRSAENVSPRETVLTESPSTGVGNFLRRSVKLSIIIPAYNEATVIIPTLERLDENALEREAIELIVVNAQSKDNTADIVKRTFNKLRFGAKVLMHSQPGRAAAQNLGAQQATGDVFLFLHADTMLPLGYDKQIRDTLYERGVIAGAFSFGVGRKSFKGKPPVGLGIMEYFTNFRCRHFMLSYGDQGLFMLRARFQQIRPFPDVLMMEDFEMVRRLRKQALTEGARIAFLPSVALCSGRRWEKNGVLKNTLLNQWFVFSYTVLAFPASKIYEWYYHVPPPTTTFPASPRKSL